MSTSDSAAKSAALERIDRLGPSLQEFAEMAAEFEARDLAGYAETVVRELAMLRAEVELI